MPRNTVTVDSIIISRLDKIDSILDKQNIILENIQKQTALTNGRVTVLEKDLVESKTDRKEIHTVLDNLKKSNDVNEGIKQAIREVQNEYKATHRFWWTEARSLIPIIVSILMSIITIYVTFFR